jgi:hypothetical protein
VLPVPPPEACTWSRTDGVYRLGQLRLVELRIKHNRLDWPDVI